MMRTTMKGVLTGPAAGSPDVYFTSIEAALSPLTPDRLARLQAIRVRRPGSIHALAEITRRDLENVQDDPPAKLNELVGAGGA